MGVLDGIIFRGFSVAPRMIRRGLGDAVGLVDSVVPGMICRGRIEKGAYGSISSGGCPSPLG